jgi:hypothetical protein
MQVADSNELVTSATLGAKEAMAFGISEDPAFFQILSANLYSNQKLAMVRETLCNSWDAHIEAGLQDKPITVTIDKDGFLYFRDFGSGIPHSKIGAVYGTYGASTKKTNTNVTGGFGLGCKSPMAYTDSFTVTSYNEGTKTVYLVAKSSVETNGKPGIVPIVNMPTTESGLEVKIQIQPNDISEIANYIRAIVLHGEIKCIFHYEYANEDSVTLPVLGMSFEPGSYNADGNWYYQYMGRHSIFIRYGNVIYPALETPATEQALGLVKQFMAIIGCHYLLVQAAPSTLALSPSRETLSSQKMTEDGIVDMAVALVAKMEADIKENIPKAINAIKYRITEWDMNGISCKKYLTYTQLVDDRTTRGYMESTLWRVQRAHLVKECRNLEVNRQLQHKVLGNVDKKVVARLRKTLKVSKHGNPDVLHTFLRKQAIEPILKRLVKMGVTMKDVTFYVSRNGSELVKSNIINEKMRYLSDFTPLNYRNNSLRFFVTTRMRGVEDSIEGYPSHTTGYGETWKNNAIIIRVGTKKDEVANMVQLLQANGHEVIDLTQNHKWDVIAQERIATAKMKASLKAKQAKKTPEQLTREQAFRPNRLISMNCMDLGKKQPYRACNKNNASPTYGDKHVDVENPKYYIMQEDVDSGGGQLGVLANWKIIPQDIRDVTVVCRNKIEMNKAINRGAVHLDEWAGKYIVDVALSKEMLKYVTKERQKTLADMGVSSQYLKLLRVLGINYAPLKGLRYDEKLEQVFEWLRGHYGYNRIRVLKRLELINDEQANVIENHEEHQKVFTKYKAFKHLIEIFREEAYGGVLLKNRSPEELLREIKERPENLPIIKSLIKSALKRKPN